LIRHVVIAAISMALCAALPAAAQADHFERAVKVAKWVLYPPKLGAAAAASNLG